MFCANCGTRIPEGGAFCPGCGKPVMGGAAAQKAAAGQAMAPAQNTPPAQNAAPAQNAVPVQNAAPKQTVAPAQHVTPAYMAANGGVGKSERVTVCGVTLPPTLAKAEKLVRKIGEPKMSAPHVENPANAEALKQITGDGYSYYATRFSRIFSTGSCGINWWSFIFSYGHAAYRNVWKEWLMDMKYGLIALILTRLLWILSGIAGAAELCAFFGTVSDVVSVAVFWPMALRTALRFNKLYMLHVDEKLAAGDVREDENWGRAVIVSVICVLVFWGLYVVGGTLQELLIWR